MDKSISLTSTANPTRLYDSAAKFGLSHLLKTCLLRIPSQTQCIQSTGTLEGMYQCCNPGVPSIEELEESLECEKFLVLLRTKTNSLEQIDYPLLELFSQSELIF